VGTHRSAVAQAAATEGGRATATPLEAGDRRHFLRAADRLSVEGRSEGVRIRQFAAPLLSAAGQAAMFCRPVGHGLVGVRRPGRPGMEVAIDGWGDDQGAAGRGKKPGTIRPIGPNRGPSAAC
jgi:hypothetical protein